MKTKLIFLVLILATTSLFAQNVTFGDSTLATGTSWTDSSSYGSTIAFTVDTGMGGSDPNVNGTSQLLPAVQTQSTAISRTKRITITSTRANGKKIGGFSIVYTNVTVNGVDQTNTYAGKTYSIDVNGNHVNGVTFGDGSVVPAGEAAFVSADNSNINQALELANTLGGETIAIGSTVNAKNLDDLFDVAAGFDVDGCTLTLASVSAAGPDQVATFNVTLSISSSATGGIKKGKNASSASAPFTTSSLHLGPLAGQLHAHVASGRVLDFSVAGPATAGGVSTHGKDRQGNDVVGKKTNGDTRSMSISGNGTATLSASFAY